MILLQNKGKKISLWCKECTDLEFQCITNHFCGQLRTRWGAYSAPPGPYRGCFSAGEGRRRREGHGRREGRKIWPKELTEMMQLLLLIVGVRSREFFHFYLLSLGSLPPSMLIILCYIELVHSVSWQCMTKKKADAKDKVKTKTWQWRKRRHEKINVKSSWMKQTWKKVCF